MSGALSPSLRPLSKDIDQTTAPLPPCPTHTPRVYARIVCSYTFTTSSTSLSFYFFNFLVLLYFYLHFYNTYSASKLQSQLPPPTTFRSQRLHFSVCSSLLCKPYKAFQNKGLRHGWKRFILFFMLVRCRT